MILIQNLASLTITSFLFYKNKKKKGGSRGLTYTTLSETMGLSFKISTHETGCIILKEESGERKHKFPDSSNSWPRDAGHGYFLQTLSQKINPSTVIPDGTESILYFKNQKHSAYQFKWNLTCD